MYLMIVSDDDATVDALTAACSGRGSILSFARSAEDALAQLAGRITFYDWVIVDYELPDLSGLELARHVVDMGERVRIAVVSKDPTVQMPPEQVGKRVFGPASPDWSGEEFHRMFALAS